MSAAYGCRKERSHFMSAVLGEAADSTGAALAHEGSGRIIVGAND
jgi:hypothetical protein